MSRIRDKNTKPEIKVRSIVHGLGFRYRLHIASLPGKPDIVLTRLKKIILVHGCFWHMHKCKYGKVKPATNVDFWLKKRMGNAERDKRNIKDLKNLGWEILVVWECEIKKKPEKVAEKIGRFLK
jgi:DNA mismatch endonuclease (patch repair protein)